VGRPSHRSLTCFVVTLVMAQALWTSLATIAFYSGFEPARYMCASLADAQLPSAARPGRQPHGAHSAHAPQHGASDGGDIPVHQHGASDDCAACFVSQVVALSAPPTAAPNHGVARARFTDRQINNQTASCASCGPPVGSRAPPLSV